MTDEELDELSHPDYGRGRCRDESLALAREDRTLTVVRGYADGVEHWWLIDPDGKIVDPTVDQFVCTPFEYVPESVGVPAERPPLMCQCVQCGDVHDGGYCNDICSEGCAKAFCLHLGVRWAGPGQRGFLI